MQFDPGNPFERQISRREHKKLNKTFHHLRSEVTNLCISDKTKGISIVLEEEEHFITCLIFIYCDNHNSKRSTQDLF